MTIKTALHIAYYELRHIWKNPILFLIVFLAPTVYGIFFGAVYCHAVLAEIPLGIVDLDHSGISRELTAAFSNDPYFKIVPDVSSYQELEEAMHTGKVRAGIVIPEQFEKKVQHNRQTEVLNVYDASNLIWGLNTRKNAMEVINKFNNQYTVEYLSGAGLNTQESLRIVNAVEANVVSWYNPTNSYPTYIVIGLMMMLLQQLGLMSSGLTVTREKENNTWLHFVSSGVAWPKIVLGKCLPYFLANFLNYTLVACVAFEIGGAKMEGNIGLFLTMGIVYDLVITFMGFVISLLAEQSLQVTRYLTLLSLPIFIMSGYTWPSTHIPGFINALASIFPSTWMMKAERIITVKGLGINYLGTNILVLLSMAGASLLIAFLYPHIERRLPV